MDYYRLHKRSFPWRATHDPYRILVSEIMLQQTQTIRVVKKYKKFLKKFPTIRSLGRATLRSVMGEWKGLGYNRRALALKKTAEIISRDYAGKVPVTLEALMGLPGIGRATASAICAFAFNQPAVFIETNIRSVYLDYFFKGRRSVTDDEIMMVVAETVDARDPRQWYYALMDYGVYLKEKYNPGRQSAHYRKQIPFQGSSRQLRGRIVSLVCAHAPLARALLYKKIGKIMEQEHSKSVVDSALDELVREGLIKKNGNKLSLD